MSNFSWGGAFAKHRLGTGDIRNHIIVNSVEPVSDAGYDELLGDEVDRTEIFGGGEGAKPYKVTVGFLKGSGNDYEFIVWMNELDEERALDLVAHEIQP